MNILSYIIGTWIFIYMVQIVMTIIFLCLGDIKTKKDLIALFNPLYPFILAYAKYKELE